MDEPALRTIAMPADTNPHGDIFGGWLISQMDLAGANVAARRAGGRVVTIAIDALEFHEPVEVGDEVSSYGTILRTGRTSITVNVVAPGFIDTDMTKELAEEQRQALIGQIPLNRLGDPADIAAAVTFLASSAAAYITGETINVNGGMYMP